MTTHPQEHTPKIHAGLELLSALGAIELKSVEIRDLLYNLITKDFTIIDDILETAQKEKLLQRTEKTYVLIPGASGLQFEKPRIVKQNVCTTPIWSCFVTKTDVIITMFSIIFDKIYYITVFKLSLKNLYYIIIEIGKEYKRGTKIWQKVNHINVQKIRLQAKTAEQKFQFLEADDWMQKTVIKLQKLSEVEL